MNTEIIPGVIAATGGVAMLGGIALHEHRRDEVMRASRVRLVLRFPAGLEPSAAVAVLDGFSGLPTTAELVVELSATDGEITHAIWVPKVVRSSVESILTGAIPGLRLTEAPSDSEGRISLARSLWMPTPTILSADDPIAASRVLLTGLSALRRGERVVVRWALRPWHAPSVTEADQPDARKREIERAWRGKTASAGMRVSGAILVAASKPGRARELASQIESVLRSRRGLAGAIHSRAVRGARSFMSIPRTTRSSGWLSGAELLPLVAFPLGSEAVPGVAVGVSRQLPVPRNVATEGRVLFAGYDRSGERPVALSAETSKHHVAIVGPTGVGKSSLIAGCVLQDIRAGYGGVVIDPKADLTRTILDRVRPVDADRIVVLDPADDRPLPGLAILGGGDPDLRAEALTGAMRSIFADAWTIRTDFYLHLVVRTLAEVPGSTFADVARLFFDQAYRHAAVARLRDPFLVSSWQSYEALSEAARAEHVAAPMNRVMGLLARPRVRSVLACRDPKLNVGQLLRQRKWLLVSLSPGQIGEASAALIAAVVMYATWAAVEARAALPPEQRRFVAIYADELATLTGGVPFSFEQIAERARGLGAGLTVAMQTLGRVPEPTRSALLGNVGSFLSFRAGGQEAPRIARQLPGLSERDIVSLDRFAVAARIGTGLGSSVSVLTGRTLPLPPTTGMAEAIRDASSARYGTPAEPVQPAAPAPVTEDEASLGVKRRRS